MSKFIGVIVKNKGYYNFKISKCITENGAVRQINGDELMTMIQEYHPDFDMSCVNNRKDVITIWNMTANANEYLDVILDRELVLDIDLDTNVEMNQLGTGFCTVRDYTDCCISEIGFDDRCRIDIGNTIDDVLSHYKAFLDECHQGLSAFVQDNRQEYINNHDGFVYLIKSLDAGFNELDVNHNLQNDVIEVYRERERTQYYMLKVGYAYLYLYYSMYRKVLDLFSQENLGDRMDIMSIGCGSKIDTVGLRLASLLHEDNRDVSYYGIEPGDWIDNGLCIYTNDGSFTEKAFIQDYLKDNQVNANVVMLPYSLQELVKEEYAVDGETPWQILCRVLPSKIIRDRIVVLTALRGGGDETYLSDYNNFEELIQSFKANGFHVLNNQNIVVDNHNAISRIQDSDWGLEGQRVKSYLGYDQTGNIYTLMANEIKNIDASIRSIPMAGMKYICYRVVVFERDTM